MLKRPWVVFGVQHIRSTEAVASCQGGLDVHTSWRWTKLNRKLFRRLGTELQILCVIVVRDGRAYTQKVEKGTGGLQRETHYRGCSAMSLTLS